MVSGNYGALTAEQARRLAAQVLAQAAAGRDPAAERLEAPRGDTITDLAECYLAEYAIKKKSGREDERKLRVDILPKLGRLKVRDVTMADTAACLDASAPGDGS